MLPRARFGSSWTACCRKDPRGAAGVVPRNGLKARLKPPCNRTLTLLGQPATLSSVPSADTSVGELKEGGSMPVVDVYGPTPLHPTTGEFVGSSLGALGIRA